MQLLHDYLLYLAQFFLNCLGVIEQHLSALSCMRDQLQFSVIISCIQVNSVWMHMLQSFCLSTFWIKHFRPGLSKFPKPKHIETIQEYKSFQKPKIVLESWRHSNQWCYATFSVRNWSHLVLPDNPFQRRQTGQIKSNHSTLLKNHIFIYHSLVIRHSNALPIVFWRKLSWNPLT